VKKRYRLYYHPYYGDWNVWRCYELNYPYVIQIGLTLPQYPYDAVAMREAHGSEWL